MTGLDTFRSVYQATSYREFGADDQARLEGRLPPEMVELLRLDGFASYAEQLLWSVDPDDMGDTGSLWLPDSGPAVPLFRTAFGNLFLWNGQRVYYANIHFHTVAVAAVRMRFLLKDTLVDQGFVNRVLSPARVSKARAEAGPLEPGEAYFWVPALALGGDEKTSAIRKGGLLETITLQAQMAPIVRP